MKSNLLWILAANAAVVAADPLRRRTPQATAFGRAVDDERASFRELELQYADLSMSTAPPTPPPTPPPTTAPPTASPAPSPAPSECPLTEGTTFSFNSYIKESDLIFDDTYVHQVFSITVKCDCHGKAVNGGTSGPSTQVNLVDSAVTDGPFINVINNDELQVDWEGGAVEEDAPGWTIVATGSGLCFTPAAKVGVCVVVVGLATEIFDDEILWGYRRSAVFSCEEDGDSWEVQMIENARTETFVTNDSEFYTEYDSSSAAPANSAEAVIATPSEERTVDEASSITTTSAGVVKGSGVALVALLVSLVMTGV